MLKIWGRSNSTNVRKVLWCADELGLAYENIPAGGSFGVVDTAAYQALNPNRRIPCLQDDGLVLWESNAIVRYLSAQYGQDILYSAEPAKRAEADKWMDWTTSTLAGPFRPLFWGVLRTPPAEQDWRAIGAALQQCAEILEIPNAVLANQPYLSGSAFGMGDIPLGSFVYAWFEMPIERPDLPYLAQWYERLKQRPAYRKSVMTALT